MFSAAEASGCGSAGCWALLYREPALPVRPRESSLNLSLDVGGGPNRLSMTLHSMTETRGRCEDASTRSTSQGHGESGQPKEQWFLVHHVPDTAYVVNLPDGQGPHVTSCH
ncbi:hypothetical protein MRX96_020502 [Rhipicephalus microplus]